jgi:hypothetical protein
MTRTRIGNVIVAALVIGLITWIARHTYWAEVTVAGIPQGEAARNQYYSLQRLAGALGIRNRLIASMNSPPPRGAVLLINGLQEDLLQTRVESLAPWVETGGRLIITDDVVWANPPIQKWSGIAPGSHLVDKDAKASRLRASRDDDEHCDPMTVKVDGTPTGATMTLCAPGSGFEFVSQRVPAWSLSSEFGMQILRVNIGRGSVTVIPRSALIGNKGLLRGDHAQIFVTAAQLLRGDQLYILNVTNAETLISMLWRLIPAAIVFFGIAILCMIARELPRFGPLAPIPAAVRRSVAEQIRANAAFAWRTRKLGSLRTAVSRALEETARKRIAAYGALAIRGRVAALSELTGVDLRSLNAAMTEDAAAGAHVQRTAIALLEHTRRTLKIRTQKMKGRRE